MLAALVSLLALAACGDGDGGPDASPTATEAPAAATPTREAASEAGSEPVFYRTVDNFATLRAGEPYKVLFRITGGFADPALRVTAECTSCTRPAERQPVELEGQRAEPVGEEAPGSYYPMNIVLPFPGTWRLVVMAGESERAITVEVQPGEPPAG